MKVSVIIPNYNGIDFIKPCLDSLEKQTFKDFDIIIVDNNSTDNSVNYIKANYPNINLIKLQENFGFSKAVNEGIKASNAEYVLLLNNDTESTPTYIEELVKAIEKKPCAFSVASKMIQLHNPNLLDSAGDLYTSLGWAVNRGVGRNTTLYSHSCKIFTACAGAAIYRKDAFEKIGYFDEAHFAYLEDIDIGYRAKLYGYSNYYAPKAHVYHVGSGTSGSKYNAFKVTLSSRNSIYLNYKNMPNWQIILNALPLGIGYIVKYAFFKKLGLGKEYINGIKEGLKTRHNLTRTIDKEFSTYLKIECELIINTFIYVFDWIRRKTDK